MPRAINIADLQPALIFVGWLFYHKTIRGNQRNSWTILFVFFSAWIANDCLGLSTQLEFWWGFLDGAQLLYHHDVVL